MKYRLGVDLGGTNIKVGIIDENYNIVGKKSGDTGAERSFQEVVADMARLLKELVAEKGIDLADCEKIGIGSPGMINHTDGVVRFAGNLGWEDAPIAAELGQYFDVPVRLANDADCAVYGEVLAGAAKGCSDAILITLGTGVGGGVVSNSVLQQGGSAGGMELGHTLLVMDGEDCTCGRKGCLEAYASASGLARHGAEAAEKNKDTILYKMYAENGMKMNGAIPFKAAQAGCAVAQEVVDYYIKCLGEGLIDFINIWRPEKVLLGGGISNEGAPLLDPLNEYVRTRCFAGDKGYVPPIEVAKLGNDAGLIGAACL